MKTLDLMPFETLVKAHCGLQFEGDAKARLAQALQQRTAQWALPASAYYQRLQRDAAEMQALVNLLTINETYFLREREQIDLLVQRLAPRALARRGTGAAVRILSAACSSGEEPYSLAIALQEKYGESAAALFHIVAGDIDTEVLAKAQAAVYGEFSFRGVPESIRAHYFEQPPQGGWRPKAAVRQMVQWLPLNLLEPPFPASVHDCDVIFLRNVSIYFDTATRTRMQQHMATLLAPQGVLVVGTAETLANDVGVLHLAEEAGLFYFTPQTAEAPPRAPVPALHSAPHSAAPPAPCAPPAPLTLPAHWKLPQPPPAPDLLPLARSAVQAKNYPQALAQLDTLLQAQPTHAGACLLKGYVLLERKDWDGAQALAQQVLDAEPWSVDACMLLGLAAKWRGDSALAQRWLRQVIYTRHDCWPAHYFLADLLHASGAHEPAQRSWRVVVQLLSATPLPDTGLHHLPLELPAPQIRFLCQQRLDHQKKTS